MSCEKCEKARDQRENSRRGAVYYQWGKAKIEIIACHEHTVEIIRTLNEKQKEVEKEVAG